MIVKTVSAINKYFSDMNRGLQATGLPAYQINVWQGMGANGNTNQIDDINQITNIAQGKTAESDAGPTIGRMILKYIPEYEAENDELGYEPEDFANAKKVASIYIAKGERAGLAAQHKLDSHVSEMIDELLSDHGGSGLRTVWELDEGEGVAEGKLAQQVDHRGDVDLDADIEVLGVDYNTKTWKITYNGKPYTVKADYFSREDLSRWQIPDYDVEIINRNGKNIMNMIDWDNEGSSKTDRQIKMVNTIIAYLDTENAQDIQHMAWKDQYLDNNKEAHELYNEIRDFYNKDQQKINQTVQWLLKNMTDDQAREVFAGYIKNPVNPLDQQQNLKNNRTYLMYVAFSYSREGNTEMTPGMNLPKIQLNDPDDEDELQYQLDALFKKVEFKFDAFENKIIELSKKFSLPNPDLGSGMGAREMFWELICHTAWPKEYKYIRNAATNILNFKAAVDKYVQSFNSSLIKIGLPGITEYSTWNGVLGDDLTEQQVNYFATPEGFANVANGKIDVSKMINDNMQRKSLEEKLGDNRPKLGTKRDAGKSVRKWRKARGLDETGVAEGNKKPEQPEADYGDDYQDMVARVNKLAGLGPLKTVYDPTKRVYRNMPTAVQPKK